jgi:hypothetical protein
LAIAPVLGSTTTSTKSLPLIVWTEICSFPSSISNLAEIGDAPRSLAFKPSCKVAVASFIAAANAAVSSAAAPGGGHRTAQADRREQQYQ